MTQLMTARKLTKSEMRAVQGGSWGLLAIIFGGCSGGGTTTTTETPKVTTTASPKDPCDGTDGNLPGWRNVSSNLADGIEKCK